MRRDGTAVPLWMVAACLVVTLAAPIVAQRGTGAGTGGGTGAGTGGGRGPIVGTPPSTGAARGGRATRPASTSPSAIAVKNAIARVKAINKAVATLDKTAAKTAPKNSLAADLEQWTGQATWIRSVKARYAAYGEALDTATKSSGDSMDVLLRLTELDEQFIALQVATEEESPKFTGLSKAAKSRQDATLKAVRGIK